MRWNSLFLNRRISNISNRFTLEITLDYLTVDKKSPRDKHFLLQVLVSSIAETVFVRVALHFDAEYARQGKTQRTSKNTQRYANQNV